MQKRTEEMLKNTTDAKKRESLEKLLKEIKAGDFDKTKMAVQVDTTRRNRRQDTSNRQQQQRQSQRQRRGRNQQQGRSGVTAGPGEYGVKMTVNGIVYKSKLIIRQDPILDGGK